MKPSAHLEHQLRPRCANGRMLGQHFPVSVKDCDTTRESVVWNGNSEHCRRPVG